MNRTGKHLAYIGMLAILFGCAESDSDKAERYDVGYSDGFAEGFNTECKIRATLIEGDWGNESYSAGYSAGRRAGVKACWDRNK